VGKRGSIALIAIIELTWYATFQVLYGSYLWCVVLCSLHCSQSTPQLRYGLEIEKQNSISYPNITWINGMLLLLLIYLQCCVSFYSLSLRIVSKYAFLAVNCLICSASLKRPGVRSVLKCGIIFNIVGMVCPKRVLFNWYIHLLCIECKETVNNRPNFIHRCIYYEYNVMAIILSRSLYNRDLFSLYNFWL